MPRIVGGRRGRIRKSCPRYNKAQSEFREVRKVQAANGIGDVREGVGTGVAVVRGVGQFADANRVHHDENRAVDGS